MGGGSIGAGVEEVVSGGDGAVYLGGAGSGVANGSGHDSYVDESLVVVGYGEIDGIYVVAEAE